MLYDTVGPVLLVTLAPGQFIETLELHTTFLRPATTGRLIGRGRVVTVNGDVAELDGTLADSTGEVVATAIATARIIERTPNQPAVQQSGPGATDRSRADVAREFESRLTVNSGVTDWGERMVGRTLVAVTA